MFLNVKGKGHYVGTVLSVVQAEAGWFGEGDDFFWVDGAPKPSIEGTGSEDYFNDAWGLHVNDSPYYGVTVAEGTGLGSRMTAYRWHLVDPVPFQKSLKVEIEHKGWTFNADGSVKSGFGERDGPDVERRVLVPGGDRPRPAAGSLRRRAPSPGQRAADRGRDARSPTSRPRRARSRSSRTSSGPRTSSCSRARGPARR